MAGLMSWEALDGVFLRTTAQHTVRRLGTVVVWLSASIIDIVCGVFGHNFSIIKSITVE